MGMTDREKLIELIHDCRAMDGYGQDLVERQADHLIAHGVTVQRWVPVTERLPEKEDTYLVYTERGSVYSSHFYTEMKFASGYVREASWSQRGKVKVTHWMPLPEPPKEGE